MRLEVLAASYKSEAPQDKHIVYAAVVFALEPVIDASVINNLLCCIMEQAPLKSQQAMQPCLHAAGS